jgi:DNA modification methylase
MRMNQFFIGDSFQVLPTLFSDSFDAIITDVPYDLKSDQKEWLQAQFRRISRGWIIVFSPPENPWTLPADQYLFWIKPESTKNTSKRYSRYVEMIFVYGSGYWAGGEAKDNRNHWTQFTNIFNDRVIRNTEHMYKKPESMIERLIRNHTILGQSVLDPFAGTGTIGDIAARLGRDFLCIEKDEQYARV